MNGFCDTIADNVAQICDGSLPLPHSEGDQMRTPNRVDDVPRMSEAGCGESDPSVMMSKGQV
eukprot:CAMPEP_0194541352 /NCGR_PEP_ID=MMETSP0253-20130528/82058_1 /TAXON_ID=2966 /ORGANISM="Noctiluca scintillans" /LENGTH=61 /DNA_ID=CAMNT_0039387827 /DNA_START=152 /DNA_END=337 /DNA_ORIENTATION=-